MLSNLIGQVQMLGPKKFTLRSRSKVRSGVNVASLFYQISTSYYCRVLHEILPCGILLFLETHQVTMWK